MSAWDDEVSGRLVALEKRLDATESVLRAVRELLQAAKDPSIGDPPVILLDRLDETLAKVPS